MEDVKKGIYRHFKGEKTYRVLGVAKHSETLEEFVVYEALYQNPQSKLWIRPKAMFMEDVTRDGKTTQRFTLIEEEK